MDVSPLALLRNFVPQIPSILLTSIGALLGWTENSSDQDAITQIIVAAARPILRSPAQIGRSQRVWRFVGEWSAWGLDLAGMVGLGGLLGVEGVRVRKEVFKVGGGNGADEVGKRDDLRDEKMGESGRRVMNVGDAVAFAFESLCDPKHGVVDCPIPDIVDVEVDWTTSTSRSADRDYSNTARSEKGSVILYLHGGAHCLMDPTTHRWTTSILSKLSSIDVCSVRFRLSPQNPFPAALIDAFVVYLTLVAPTLEFGRGAVHPSRIVIAGDSSGGGMAASLVLLLLTLSRNQVDINFRGSVIRIADSPCAGLALTSPWVDITRSLPSTSRNAKWDIIAPPPLDSASPPFPPDEAWPCKPPRAETYCTATMCTHPLASPLAAKKEQWVGAPPVWVCTGWEACTDETEVFARRVLQSGPKSCVSFRGWEGMPHCFGMFPWNRAGWSALTEWTQFCSEALEGKVRRETTAIWHGGTTQTQSFTRDIGVETLGLETSRVGYTREFALTDEVVDGVMDKGREWRIYLEHELVKGRGG